MSTEEIKVAFLLADYGHDPTETAIPFSIFKSSNFTITILTESGSVPSCDKLMLQGWTQKLLGADSAVLATYSTMTDSPEWRNPTSWTSLSSLSNFDLVFLPGGHDKGVRQLLDSEKAQSLLAGFWPEIKRPRGRKVCAAVCHGVQVLAHARKGADSGEEGGGRRSLLHDVTTTALPSTFENLAYGITRAWLGDYYKTYGAGTKNVEEVVKEAMDDGGKRQWRGSVNLGKAVVVVDEGYNYLSGRWPGDAKLLAEKAVEMVRKVRAT